MTERTVAFLGGGKMGEALISGLIRSGGRTADEIMVTCRRDERARELGGKYGIAATLDNGEAARWASTLVLMAKPQDIEHLLGEIRAHVTPTTLVISFAAGIRTSCSAARSPSGFLPIPRCCTAPPTPCSRISVRNLHPSTRRHARSTTIAFASSSAPSRSRGRTRGPGVQRGARRAR